MTQRDYTRNVKIGDTVYINTRSKNHVGKSAVVLLKDYRRAKVQFADGSTTWFSFYSLDKNPTKCETVPDNSNGFTDTLKIDYEEFSEEGCKVLTVSRNGEALAMFHNDTAEIVYRTLLEPIPIRE